MNTPVTSLYNSAEEYIEEMQETILLEVAGGKYYSVHEAVQSYERYYEKCAESLNDLNIKTTVNK